MLAEIIKLLKCLKKPGILKSLCLDFRERRFATENQTGQLFQAISSFPELQRLTLKVENLFQTHYDKNLAALQQMLHQMALHKKVRVLSLNLFNSSQRN